MNDIIQPYLLQVLVEANLGDLPDDFKKSYLEQLEEELHRRLGVAALRAMPDEALDAFDKLITEKPDLPQDMMVEFYQTHIPDFAGVVNNALLQFKTDFIEKAKALAASAS